MPQNTNPMGYLNGVIFKKTFMVKYVWKTLANKVK